MLSGIRRGGRAVDFGRGSEGFGISTVIVLKRPSVGRTSRVESASPCFVAQSSTTMRAEPLADDAGGRPMSSLVIR